MSPPLTQAGRRDWLRLARTENVGPVTFRQLILRYGEASLALAALPDLARRGAAVGFRPWVFRAWRMLPKSWPRGLTLARS